MVYVLAIDWDTDETIAQVEVDPSSNGSFVFDALPAGYYYLVAGTDLNDDGYLCDEGEWCGSYQEDGWEIMLEHDGVTPISGIEILLQRSEGMSQKLSRR